MPLQHYEYKVQSISLWATSALFVPAPGHPAPIHNTSYNIIVHLYCLPLGCVPLGYVLFSEYHSAVVILLMDKSQIHLSDVHHVYLDVQTFELVQPQQNML